MSRPRILLLGYSEVGYACLSFLPEHRADVIALITHENNIHENLVQDPAVAAREKGIPVYTPDKVKTPEWIERLAVLKPDMILSVYYGI